MATFLFWNLNRKPLQNQVATLCREHEVDIMILAESKLSRTTLLEALNPGQDSKFRTPFNPSTRLSFFIRYPARCLRLVHDDGGVAIRRLIPSIGPDILLVAVHLPSKLHYSDTDQAFGAIRVMEAIQRAESKVGHTRTIVVGDFNMNPFEAGVVGAGGFHAVMDRQIALRGERTVQGEQYQFFYNPMWSRMGDSSTGPPGTYYRSISSPINFFWNTLDQVLIRPDLLELFWDTKLQVVCDVAGESLLSANGIPDTSFGSDHLPLVFEIDIERRV